MAPQNDVMLKEVKQQFKDSLIALNYNSLFLLSHMTEEDFSQMCANCGIQSPGVIAKFRIAWRMINPTPSSVIDRPHTSDPPHRRDTPKMFQAKGAALSSPKNPFTKLVRISEGIFKSQGMPMNFHPSAVGSFHLLRQLPGTVYVDKTAYIRELEKKGWNFVVLHRPRRMGKSLFASTLSTYYDILNESQFDEIFGGLNIAQQPTSLRTSLVVLSLSFAGSVRPSSDKNAVSKEFNEFINAQIKHHLEAYHHILVPHQPEEIIISGNASLSLVKFGSLVKNSNHKMCIIIDEYDSFVSRMLLRPADTYPISADFYDNRISDLNHQIDLISNIFQSIKTMIEIQSSVRNWFVFGVLPVPLTDHISGGLLQDISTSPNFQTICGYEKQHVVSILTHIKTTCYLQIDIDRMVDRLEVDCNGYYFSWPDPSLKTTPTPIFCSQLCNFFFSNLFQRDCDLDAMDMTVLTPEDTLRSIVKLGLISLYAYLDIVIDGVKAGKTKKWSYRQLFSGIQNNDMTHLWSIMNHLGILTISPNPVATYCTTNAFQREQFVSIVNGWDSCTTDQFRKIAARDALLCGHIENVVTFIKDVYGKKGFKEMQDLRETSLLALLQSLFLDFNHRTERPFLRRPTLTDISRNDYADLVVVRGPAFLEKGYDLVFELKYCNVCFVLMDNKLPDPKNQDNLLANDKFISTLNITDLKKLRIQQHSGQTLTIGDLLQRAKIQAIRYAEQMAKEPKSQDSTLNLRWFVILGIGLSTWLSISGDDEDNIHVY